jgi:hypothetical protein
LVVVVVVCLIRLLIYYILLVDRAVAVIFLQDRVVDQKDMDIRVQQDQHNRDIQVVLQVWA